jgi:putative thiamine transport system permease protein
VVKTIRRLNFVASVLLAAVVLLPLLWVLLVALSACFSASAWGDLLSHPTFAKGLTLSLWTGLLSTALAYALTAWIISRNFAGQGLQAWIKRLPLMLAVPHAAFAIGLFFLLSPSGWLLRLLSPWLTGFEWPPAWQTTQDPLGIGLIIALVAKETPFLLWNTATQLSRDDVQSRWQREHALAQTLGYSPSNAFWRVIWPQLAMRLRWPLLAVLVYGLTVVDMAIIIGPASPPTLAVQAWQWLQDADALTNDIGAAAAALLGLCTLLAVAMVAIYVRFIRDSSKLTSGQRGLQKPRFKNSGRFSDRMMDRLGAHFSGFHTVRALLLLYIVIMFILAISSVSGVWPFPHVFPQTYTFAAWLSVWQSSSTVWTTLSLALVSSGLVLLWCVAWLEIAPAAWDALLRKLLYLPILMPTVLWVFGLHQMSLSWGVDGQWLGLLVAHMLVVLPYVFIALAPAYLGFDARYAQVSASLCRSRFAFLLQVKWPLLRASLASAFAVGFAVSVAQYLPTLFVGAGRFQTVTTEAVTLASGGQRSLTAAYAWLQFVLPLLCFAIAARIGKTRIFKSAEEMSPEIQGTIKAT